MNAKSLGLGLAATLLIGTWAVPAFAEDPPPPPCTAKKKTNCTPTSDHPKDPTAPKAGV